MRFRQFDLRCECGLPPAAIQQVGLSPERQLVIHWLCAGCGKAMFVVRDLADCWEDCPKSEESEAATGPGHEPETPGGDAGFLRRMGICFPGEGEAS
jgi:hypothetical protein